MSKHDRDNRSNQLNPNNVAYSSSRTGANSDNDDDSSSSRRDTIESRLAKAFEPYSSEIKRFEATCREKFEFDFVSFGGQIALLEFTAVLEKKVDKFYDCQDIAEQLFEKLLTASNRTFETPVAFAQIRRAGATSQLICNHGRRYNPTLKSTRSSADEIKRYDMWIATGQTAVEKLEMRIQNREVMTRESLGEITPAMFGRR